MSIEFKEMVTCYKLGLHETGYIVYGEPFLSIRSPLHVIRKIMPLEIAKDIVGVSPMTGPIGKIFTLWVKNQC